MMKAIIRKLIPARFLAFYRSHKQTLALRLLSWFAASGWRSSVYYLFFSAEFRREHQAVLYGRVKYHQFQQSPVNESSALLRRNTHRLEKGLIMRPRRAVFAEQYILETVRAYCQLCQATLFCSEERKWATDVLSEYFSVVEDTPPIARARQMFTEQGMYGTSEYIPYTDQQRVRSEVSTGELEKLFMQRRSTRWFAEQPVENSKLDTAIKLASLAPSACNRQPFRFFVANQPETAREIAAMAVGTGGFAHNIPAILAVVGDLSAYPLEKDRHLIYIDGSLAAMQLMLATETLGLSSCPLNWPDIEFRERKIASRLGLSPEQRVIMLIAVGYADQQGMIPFSQKKPAAALRVDVE